MTYAARTEVPVERSRAEIERTLIKAKLETAESGISSFEEEFMAHIVLPNGQTDVAYAQTSSRRVDEPRQLFRARRYDRGARAPDQTLQELQRKDHLARNTERQEDAGRR